MQNRKCLMPKQLEMALHRNLCQDQQGSEKQIVTNSSGSNNDQVGRIDAGNGSSFNGNSVQSITGSETFGQNQQNINSSQSSGFQLAHNGETNAGIGGRPTVTKQFLVTNKHSIKASPLAILEDQIPKT